MYPNAKIEVRGGGILQRAVQTDKQTEERDVNKNRKTIRNKANKKDIYSQEDRQTDRHTDRQTRKGR